MRIAVRAAAWHTISMELQQVKRNILVIDDEPHIRSAIKQILEFEGYHVTEADNAHAGILAALSHPPDLILCDVGLPDNTGHEVLFQLRSDQRTAIVPFVFVSGYTEPAVVRSGMEMGGDDYLHKPFTAEGLLGSVRSRIRRREEWLGLAGPAAAAVGADFPMGPTDSLKHELMSDLQKALVQDEFELRFQPLFGRDGAIRGAECLLRWQSARRGFVSPAIFIPLAEHMGLIHEIGRWVFRRCCEAMNILKAAGFDGFLSVNVSPIQFGRLGLVDELSEIFDGAGLQPGDVELEVTENAMVTDIVVGRRSIKDLRDRGFSIALDDFGTGYSGLSVLHSLEIDKIKMDRAFVSGVEGDPGSRSILQHMIDLSHELGFQVCVEGIETEGQHRCIHDMNADLFQGFHLARPIEFEQFQARIVAARSRSGPLRSTA